MDNRDRVPYAPQDLRQVSNVVEAMEQHATKGKGKGKGGFTVKKKTFTISDGSGRTVDSWQLNDWDYKKPHLPTYARGLFTHRNNGKPEIAVRGYDKFFNVDEVNNTQWRNVEQKTRGPYELSVKENGCIIFIAGLDDKTLIVTSKHSTGARQDASANHAFAGEAWIDKQLDAIGKTRADLAKQLRGMNATAVAELCDDDFEEHVLQYTPESAGLYLHGINLNLPEFATYPGNQVDKFADEWGFKKVTYVLEDDIHKVKTFLDGIAETGNYLGRDTEGFVIRCQMRETPKGPWQDWFFKYKFEEPYLMYRQWREATKAVIAGKPPKYKKHVKITNEYLQYARRQLAKDPKIGKLYNQNHGIIAMRDGFLAEKGVKGSDIIRDEEEDGFSAAKNVTKNVLLCPIATIGCGKTTVALALTKLFGWGHEQNDNIQGKGRRPQRFVLAITNSMALHPVVIADRNNHQKRERQQILEDITNVVPQAKIVALHYVHDRSNYKEIRKAMQNRVFSRGDNHQTIQADSKSNEEVAGIMEGFLQRFEPIDLERAPDDQFDLVIDLDVTASSRENLETVINALHNEYPKLFQVPTEEEMDSAIQWALDDYHPDIKHDLGKPGKPEKPAHKNNENGTPKPQQRAVTSKPPNLEYFRIVLQPQRVTSILDAVFSSEPPESAKFYNQLKTTRRVQQAFHVTLIHRASISAHPDYWNKLCDAWRQQFEAHQAAGKATPPTPGTNGGVELGKVNVLLERIVWDDRVMCMVARLVDGEEKGFATVNEMAHVTVGTASDHIKPFESNSLLQRWVKGGDEKIKEVKVKGNVVLEGDVDAVIRR